MVRRAAKRLTMVGFGTLAAVVLLLICLYALGYAAPPSAAAVKPVDYEAGPSAVVDRAAHNLRATEYAYSLRITETNVTTGEQRTTALLHVTVDNGAQTYRSRVRTGVVLRNRSYAPARHYGNGMAGYNRMPKGVGRGIDAFFGSGGSGEWRYDRRWRYSVERNAFNDVDALSGAEATVVARNETTYVARVTNNSVATRVGYEGPSWVSENASANLTVYVDRRTGRIETAVFRYRNAEKGTAGRAEYDFRRYGRTLVVRPVGAYPPRPVNVLYRMDMGVRTLVAPLSLGGGSTW